MSSEYNFVPRQNALIEMNLNWLAQGLRLIDSLSHEAYEECGGQLRHILDFYECFLNGVELAHIDYDARKRGAAKFRALIAAMESLPALRGDAIVWVRMEDAAGLQVDNDFLASSIGRELMMLSSHTVHHFALIAMMLRQRGCPVEADFGVAPSTLRHRAAQSKAEAA
jgi:hypothetical protein